MVLSDDVPQLPAQGMTGGSITFLVLAHDEPDQLVRLLARVLVRLDDSAVVHIDRATRIEPFQAALRAAGLDDRCLLLPVRFNIRWGDFAVVRATLEALRAAVEQRRADAYVLISASDYPIRPVEHLRAELSSGAIYMDSAPMPDVEHEKPLSRLQYVYVGAKDRRNLIVGLLNKALRRLPPRDVARGLEGLAPHGGSQWWALPDPVARALLEYVDLHPRTIRFFSRTLNPDEMFFQTLVRRVAGDHPMREELTWADWSRPVPPGSPATLIGDDGDGDLDRIRHASRDHWFARKFDARRSRRLLDQIDEELLDPR